VGKLRPLTQLPRRPGVHSENSRPPPRAGTQGLERPSSPPCPHLAPRLVGAVTTGRPQLGRWLVGVLSVPRAPPKPRRPPHGAPRLAGRRGPWPGRPEESPRGEGAPPGDASASASRRWAIGRGGGPTLRDEGAAQRAGDAPRGPGRACPLSPSPPPRGHPRRPPPPSSGKTKAAPPEDPGFPAPSYICLDGPRTRAPQPLGACRLRSPGPHPCPARAYLRVPARRSESARRRAAPPPPAPRSGPPTGRAPPSLPDPLGPNASAAGPPCSGGRGAGLTSSQKFAPCRMRPRPVPIPPGPLSTR